MIELELLGTPALRRSGLPLAAMLVQPRRLALLAFLATASGDVQRRDRLLLLFWGDQPETRARANLRQALYFIRQSLGDDVLVTRGDNEVWLNTAAVAVDVAAFERAVTDGQPDTALALYRGDFLADFSLDNASEFERWALDRRRELRRAAATAAWQCAEAALARGAHDEAPGLILRALDLADWAEPDARRAMRAISTAGDAAGALAVYDTVRARLAQEFGVEPDATTVALAQELRDRTPAPMSANVPFAETLPRATRVSYGQRAAITAGVAVTMLLGTALWTRSHGNSPLDAAAANRVAVFPFTVRSANQAAYLREGTATLLGLALDGAGPLRVVDPNAVLSASPVSSGGVDLRSARSVASALGAGRFVLGEIESAGTRIQMTATLYDADGRTQSRAAASGDEARVFELVDSLARRLAAGAMPDSAARLASAAATATPSIAAFKAFLNGEAALRAGRYREAAAALQDAVLADSTFGLAWYRLSLAREWTAGEISSDSAAALAERFSSRLPDRDRKLLAARRAFVRRDGTEGERLARQVLASYPTDADAWAQVGEMRFHLGPNAGRSIDEARESFLNALRLRPHDLLSRVHLSRIAAHAGDSLHLELWTRPDETPGDASEIGTLELAAMRAVVLGDPRARDTVMAAMGRANEASVLSTVWRLVLYSGNPVAAARLFAGRHAGAWDSSRETVALDEASGRLLAIHPAASVAAARSAANIAMMLAMPSAPELLALARGAHSALVREAERGAGAPASRAAVAARMLEARYPEGLPHAGRGAALLPNMERTVVAITEAMRLLAKSPEQSIDAIAPERLDESLLFTLGLYDMVASIRAEALVRLHRDAEAIAWLQSIGMNSSGASVSIALAERRMAEIEEGRGAHEAAVRNWRRFVTRWQLADPELQPLVEAARRSVARR